MNRTGYSRPHTVHCGPEGIYMNALGSPDGEGPGGVFVLDGETFDVRGTLGDGPGPSVPGIRFRLASGSRCHGHQRMGHAEYVRRRAESVSFCWAASMATRFTSGICRSVCTSRSWTWGPNSNWCLNSGRRRMRPKAYGFAGRVISLKDLSSSIWIWYKDGRGENAQWKTQKVIEIPAEPADPELLPPLLKGFGAVAPLVTDVNLSLDDALLSPTPRRSCQPSAGSSTIAVQARSPDLGWRRPFWNCSAVFAARPGRSGARLSSWRPG